MDDTRKIIRAFSMVFITVIFIFSSTTNAHEKHKILKTCCGLEDIYVRNYKGGDDGGLAHVTYWKIGPGNDYYDNLPPEEQTKANKINANDIHATAFQPTNVNIAGKEVTGLLKRGRRMQSITFLLPDEWNGKLVVGGTPGLRNEYANWAVLVPWLLEKGYAYISGNKGIPGGAGDMISGKHPTQYWGQMMIDLALLGKNFLIVFTDKRPELIYAMGLSNGGYQTRRALEIDHKRVLKGRKRIFNGGVDWSGAYWPDARVMDANRDGKVSVAEYAATDSLVGSIDKGTLAMGWLYSPGMLATEAEYMKNPRFPGAYLPMVNAGFSPESAIFWGYYNTNFDPFQYVPGFEIFRGVGYYNLVSYVYRADLRGDDAVESAVYSCYSDPANPDIPPPIYEWLSNAANGGWDKESVKYALKNANTGEFSVPLLTLQGQADGLVPVQSQGLEYKDAVELYGTPELHRFYIIAHAPHVDKHADGGWGANSASVDDDIPDLLTPMQAYAQRTFEYLEEWVENDKLPPDSKLVETDPVSDITDPSLLSW